jgi:glycosyltransferase involved in cell wall biosynthesis
VLQREKLELTEEMLDTLNQDEFSALAVIVLYKLQPSKSTTFQALATAIGRLELGRSNIQVLLFDNTPGGQDPGPLPNNCRYVASVGNAGLAAAYNRALAMATTEGLDWLLTLDQDTSLPPDFLLKMRDHALDLQKDPSIGAIVPVVTTGRHLISPRYVGILSNSAVPRGFDGLSKKELYALNSAALLRVAALREIGGFCEEFWLDQLDLVLHHRLHRAGKSVFIAGDIHVQHDLSLQDYGSLSPERFRNFLQSESAFLDIYKGIVENQVLTATILFRYLKHKAKGTNPAIVQEILQVFKKRVLQSKSGRIAEWRQNAQIRAIATSTDEKGMMHGVSRPRISVCMAAYNGERFIAAQLRSILNQIGMDEVIVVDDASSDDTCGVIERLNDSRIRVMRHKTNEGVLRSFEDALELASGEIVFLSDQDDLWADEKVSKVLDAFRSNPSVDIVVSDAALIDREGLPIGPSYYATRRRFQPGVLANFIHCSYLGCTMALHARVRPRVLPFPERADLLHDLWIGTSNAISGGKTLYIDLPLVQYRRHESNATGNRRLTLGRQLRIRWDLCRSLAKAWLKPHRISTP